MIDTPADGSATIDLEPGEYALPHEALWIDLGGSFQVHYAIAVNINYRLIGPSAGAGIQDVKQMIGSLVTT